MADNPMKIKNIYFQISVDDLVRAKEFYETVFDFVSYHEMSLSSGENVENFLKALCDNLDEQFKKLKGTHGL